MSMKIILGLLAALSIAKQSEAILLNGVQVPKEKMLVYILIGHSNMAGINTRNSDGVTAPRIWKYQWFSTKSWVEAKETPGNYANGLSSRGEGGPGMPFLKGMASAYPDYNFGVISNASMSATCRGVNSGNNGSETSADSNRYWKGAFLYNEIVSIAKQVQNDVTLAGIICMLGSVEATRTSDSVCKNMGNDLAQLARDVRAELGQSNLPFIMGEYEAGSTGDFALTKPWPKLVDASIKTLPTLVPLATTINSVGIAMADDHHYHITQGQPEFAKRVIDSLKVKNWVPIAGSALRLTITAGKSLALNPANAMALPFRLDGKAKARKTQIRISKAAR